MAPQNVDDYDDAGQSSSCYSNTVFNVDAEQADCVSSTAGSSSMTAAAEHGRLASRTVRGVQFDVTDHQERPSRPHYTTVVTRDRRPTVFEKKYQGMSIDCTCRMNYSCRCLLQSCVFFNF